MVVPVLVVKNCNAIYSHTVHYTYTSFISAHVHAVADLIRVTLLHCASYLQHVTVTGLVSTDNCWTKCVLYEFSGGNFFWFAEVQCSVCELV